MNVCYHLSFFAHFMAKDRFCSTLKKGLHLGKDLGKEIKNFVICFALRSVCTNFAVNEKS